MKNSMKTVTKPWGKENWLELNNKYCFKQIFINKGNRTSFQYHKEKLETVFIMKGTAEVWFDNEYKEIEKKILSEGEFYTVKPLERHRIVAITDIILLEASSPEVDDVIRIQDDSNRCNGRIEEEHK